MEVSGQISGVFSFLLPYISQGWHSGYQAWWQTYLPTEAPHQPSWPFLLSLEKVKLTREPQSRLTLRADIFLLKVFCWLHPLISGSHRWGRGWRSKEEWAEVSGGKPFLWCSANHDVYLGKKWGCWSQWVSHDAHQGKKWSCWSQWVKHDAHQGRKWGCQSQWSIRCKGALGFDPEP